MGAVGRVGLAVVLVLPATGAVAETWAPGTRVEASPTQTASRWQVCVVVSGPEGRSEAYQLNCASDPARQKTMMVVPARWIRPAPALSGRSSLSTSRPAAPPAAPRGRTAPTAAPPAGPRDAPPAAPTRGAGGVALGRYQCWHFGSPRLLLNFEVTGPGSYVASDGSRSTFTYDPSSGRVVFSGFLGNAMPDGFTAVYDERNLPTVRFRSARGAEASFCQRK